MYKRQAYKALKAREKLTYRLGREPSVKEVAAEMEAREEDVVLALEAIQDPVSLFEPVYQDGGDAIYVMDQVRDERVSEDLSLIHISRGDGGRGHGRGAQGHALL